MRTRVVSLVAVLLALAGCSGHAAKARDYVAPGDLVTVTGLVAYPPGKAPQLCSPFMSTVDNPDPLLECPGVSSTLVLSSYVKDPELGDYLTLTGHWSPNSLRVTKEVTGPRDVSFPEVTGFEHMSVPCPTPAGGWPKGPPDWSAMNDFALRHRVLVQEVSASFQAGRDRAAIVIAATDPAAVLAVLGPVYGPRLCVVQSRYSVQQMQATRRAYDTLTSAQELPLDLTDAGQPDVRLERDVRDAATERFLRAAAPGLVRTAFWIEPVARR
ncbi:hypothetical protein acdb102_29250 [Acidothermaceae bacterium B102]|nr:hypothetical protein acdb102_29250 [Acidothermaceae bacterium B102]